MKIDGSIYDHGIEYQAVDIQVTDTLPPDEFPEENFIVDYDSTLAEYVNEDGSLKPHERFTNAASRKTESAEASFIIVTTKSAIPETRHRTSISLLSCGISTRMATELTHFPIPGINPFRHRKAGKNLQPTASRSIRARRITEKKNSSQPFIPEKRLNAPQSMLQTMTVLDSAYMQYFNIGAAAADTPELYVKVTE